MEARASTHHESLELLLDEGLAGDVTSATLPVEFLGGTSVRPPLDALVARNPALASGSEVPLDVSSLGLRGEEALICDRDINVAEDPSYCFRELNSSLEMGGLFAGVVETISQRKTRLGTRGRGVAAKLRWVVDFVLHRACPRIWPTRNLYWQLQASPNRAISLTETLGRLVHAGFEVIDVEVGSGRTAFLARKVEAPSEDTSETIGLFYCMERVGRDGRPIQVHKIRTMHPYAQHLQGYMFNGHSVAPEGKFNSDFRVTRWGRLLRRYWIDELPMLINWLKGDLKLFGVRPISRQYLSLYPDDVRKERSRYKPGLIPPYYADLPKGLDEIVDSERRYLAAYGSRPLRTDLRYLSKAIWNIAVRSARSS